MASQQDQLSEDLIAASQRCLERAQPLFAAAGVLLPSPIYRFDLHGRAAGQVLWTPEGQSIVRYNLALAALQPEAFIAETVPHEIAHVVTALCHRKARPHGPEWRRTMVFLGIDRPRRCHSFTIDPGASRAQRRWGYRCGCGTHQLSTTRHNRVRAGRQTYLCRRCGDPLRPAGSE